MINEFNKFDRCGMNDEELAIDNKWLDIMERYIEDDSTDVAVRYIDNIIVLAIKEERQAIEIYYGYSYYGAFNDSGYLDGLRDQDDDYLESMFPQDEIKLIREY